MAEEQLYDEAFAQMGGGPLELDETQPPRQKAWRKSQQYRRDRLRETAQQLGFTSIDKLCSALSALEPGRVEQLKGWLHVAE